MNKLLNSEINKMYAEPIFPTGPVLRGEKGGKPWY